MAGRATAGAEVRVAVVTAFATRVAVTALLQDDFLQDVFFGVRSGLVTVLRPRSGDRVINDARNVVAVRDFAVLLEERVGDRVEAERNAGREIARRAIVRAGVDRALDARAIQR